jgi:hypothetical protein
VNASFLQVRTTAGLSDRGSGDPRNTGLLGLSRVGLADITADDVLVAVKECDALAQGEFSTRYGFGRSRK